ncbi:hypothetical protein FB45DRAFT_868676 [Roridomyces roridus]|uniref:Uncharacterized protein n=1 Tax=Roridomyces roridus TaxID=1738132 RepID=A0AAD7BQN1_9AGAR|nr:hypothetical protein FB45DRAFT_868676 [Roridomyces roridus]
MQFNLALLTSALLVAVSPVLGADFVWFSGAGCTGSVIARSPGVTPGECVWLTNGGSAKSISYSGVPNHANFFESGGAHDVCSNGATIVTGGGSGCATGPAGSAKGIRAISGLLAYLWKPVYINFLAPNVNIPV